MGSSRDETFQTNAVEAPIMEHQHPRWRIRISTLMLLVIITALSFALIIERGKREQAEYRLRTSAAVARTQAQEAVGRAELARLQAEKARARYEEAIAGSQRLPKETPGRTTVEPGR